MMTKISPWNFRTPENLGLLVIILVTGINLCLALLMVVNKALNPDELQHLHIAWSIAQGEVLYRDFWEHHGPFYSLLNGGLIWLFDPAPSLRILFMARVISFLASLAMLAVVWKIARQLSISKFGAWLAIAVCTCFYFFINKSGEMRPDPLQALFWISGLLILLQNQRDGNLNRPIAAGVLFAFAIMSNAKAGIGPFFVGVFYLFGHWLCGLSWSDCWHDIRGMFIGVCIGLLPFVLYFSSTGALTDFLYFNYVWNFLLNYYWSTIWHGALDGEDAGVSLRNWQFFVENQPAALLLAGAAVLFWLRRIFSGQDQAARQRNWLFLTATAGTSMGWMLQQHSQFFLMFLPFWSVLISYALISIPSLFPERHRMAGISLASLMAIAACANMFWYSLQNTSWSEDELLGNQKRATRGFVGMVSRDEPVGILWNQCGGYMFNRHVGFYWVAMPYIAEVIERIDGEHPFDERYIEQLETQQVRYVVGMQEWMIEGLSDKAFAYLQENFDYANCLWTRKQP